MTYDPRDRVCIYCDARADSLEHVIPKWIPREFGLTGEIMVQRRAVGIRSGQRIPFGDYAAHVYCRHHHHVVNQLFENKATHDLIRRLFRAEADTLDGIEQRRVAGWAAKTCYAEWGKARRRRGVPISHRRHLIENGEPHPTVFVSISRSLGDWMRVIFARNHITRKQTGETFQTYDYVLVLGPLAFKVWGPTSRKGVDPYKTPTSFATRIWPTVSPIARWPPGRVLDYDGVSELWDYDPRAGATSKTRLL